MISNNPLGDTVTHNTASKASKKKKKRKGKKQGSSQAESNDIIVSSTTATVIDTDTIDTPFSPNEQDIEESVEDTAMNEQEEETPETEESTGGPSQSMTTTEIATTSIVETVADSNDTTMVETASTATTTATTIITSLPVTDPVITSTTEAVTEEVDVVTTTDTTDTIAWTSSTDHLLTSNSATAMEIGAPWDDPILSTIDDSIVENKEEQVKQEIDTTMSSAEVNTVETSTEMTTTITTVTEAIVMSTSTIENSLDTAVEQQTIVTEQPVLTTEQQQQQQQQQPTSEAVTTDALFSSTVPDFITTTTTTTDSSTVFDDLFAASNTPLIDDNDPFATSVPDLSVNTTEINTTTWSNSTNQEQISVESKMDALPDVTTPRVILKEDAATDYTDALFAAPATANDDVSQLFSGQNTDLFATNDEVNQLFSGQDTDLIGTSPATVPASAPATANDDVSQLFSGQDVDLFDQLGTSNTTSSISTEQTESSSSKQADIWAALSRDYEDDGYDMVESYPTSDTTTAAPSVVTTATANTTTSTVQSQQTYTAAQTTSTATVNTSYGYYANTATNYYASNANNYSYPNYPGYSNPNASTTATVSSAATTTTDTSFAYDGPPELYTKKKTRPAAAAAATVPTNYYSSPYANPTMATSYPATSMPGISMPPSAIGNATTGVSSSTTAATGAAATGTPDDYAYDGPPMDFFKKTAPSSRRHTQSQQQLQQQQTYGASSHSAYGNTGYANYANTSTGSYSTSTVAIPNESSTNYTATVPMPSQTNSIYSTHSGSSYDQNIMGHTAPTAVQSTEYPTASNQQYPPSQATAAAPTSSQSNQAYAYQSNATAPYEVHATNTAYSGQTTATDKDTQYAMTSSVSYNATSAPPMDQTYPVYQEHGHNTTVHSVQQNAQLMEPPTSTSSYSTNQMTHQENTTEMSNQQPVASSQSYEYPVQSSSNTVDTTHTADYNYENTAQPATTTSAATTDTTTDTPVASTEYPGWTYDYTTQQWIPSVDQNAYSGYRFDATLNQWVADTTSTETTSNTELPTQQQSTAHDDVSYTAVTTTAVTSVEDVPATTFDMNTQPANQYDTMSPDQSSLPSRIEASDDLDDLVFGNSSSATAPTPSNMSTFETISAEQANSVASLPEDTEQPPVSWSGAWSDVRSPSRADTVATNQSVVDVANQGWDMEDVDQSRSASVISNRTHPDRRYSQYSYSTEMVTQSMYGSEFSSVAAYSRPPGDQSAVPEEDDNAYGMTRSVQLDSYNNDGLLLYHHDMTASTTSAVTAIEYTHTDANRTTQPTGSDILMDPAQRPACPLVSFGFGGRMVVMFPRAVQRFGADQTSPITKVVPGPVLVSTLRDHCPAIDEDQSSEVLAPLLHDTRQNSKNKKKEILAMIDEKLATLENNEYTNVSQSSVQSRQGHRLLWYLLRLLCEHDGTAPGSGNESIDQTFCQQLHLGAVKEDVFTEVAAPLPMASPQKLSDIEYMLLRGDRAAAVDLAIEHKLWPHALMIASCVGKDTWKTTVQQFMMDQLGDAASTAALRVLYGLLAGQGRDAVEHVIYGSNNNAEEFTTAAELTAGSGSTTVWTPGQTGQAPPMDLSRWQSILCMMIANRTPGDQQALAALGDALRKANCIEAAHVCYLLSPQVSIMNGLGTSARIVLLGVDHQHQSNFYKSTEALRMSEILEFALSLRNTTAATATAATANTSGSNGFPHLQAYKLAHVWTLIDAGHLGEALRYCEAIAACVKAYAKGSPYFHTCFMQQLQIVNQRIVISTGGNLNSIAADAAASWLSKLPKPTLGSLMNAIDNGLNKFIAGDEETTASINTSTKESGPFATSGQFHSTPASPSMMPLRSASADVAVYNQQSYYGSGGDARSRRSSQGSSTGYTGGHTIMYRSSTVGQPLPAHTGRYQATTHSPLVGTTNAPTMDQRSTTYPFYNTSATNIGSDNGMTPSLETTQEEDSLDGTTTPAWYNNTSVTNELATSTTTATTSSVPFYNNSDTSTLSTKPTFYSSANAEVPSWWNATATSIDTTTTTTTTNTQSDHLGNTQSMTEEHSTQQQSTSSYYANNSNNNNNSNQFDANDDDDDDFGLGNNALRKKAPAETTSNEASNHANKSDGYQSKSNGSAPTESSAAPASKSTQENDKTDGEKKGSWSIWGLFRPGSTGGVKQAKLGEENEFYYDAELKRWVNRKAGAAATAPPPPPPPPPMASSASAPSTRFGTPATGPPPPPPTGPPAIPSNIMSSPSQASNTSSIGNGPPPALDASATPPPSLPSMPLSGSLSSGTAGGKKKRGARSRYVDIMAQNQ